MKLVYVAYNVKVSTDTSWSCTDNWIEDVCTHFLALRLATGVFSKFSCRFSILLELLQRFYEWCFVKGMCCLIHGLFFPLSGLSRLNTNRIQWWKQWGMLRKPLLGRDVTANWHHFEHLRRKVIHTDMVDMITSEPSSEGILSCLETVWSKLVCCSVRLSFMGWNLLKVKPDVVAGAISDVPWEWWIG